MAGRNPINDAINFADDVQIRLHNLVWIDNSSGGGFIGWQSKDGINPILVLYGDDTHEITPNETDLEFVYWDFATSDIFIGTDDEADVNAVDCFPLVRNVDGQVDLTWGLRVKDTKKIVDNAVTTPKVIDNAITDIAHNYAAGQAQLLVLTWTTIIAAPIFITTGGPLKIDCSEIVTAARILEEEAGENQYALFRVKRQLTGGATVYPWSSEMWCDLIRNYARSYSFGFFDSPAAGEYTYTFQGQRADIANMTAYGWNRSINIMELKK